MSLLFVFPDNTIVQGEDYEIWEVENGYVPQIAGKVEALQFVADKKHASKVMRVESGIVTWKRGDGPGQGTVNSPLPPDV